MYQHDPANFLPEHLRPTPRRFSRRVFLFLAIFILVFLGGCVGKLLLSEPAPNDPAAYDPVTLEPKTPEGLFKRIRHFVFSKDVTLEGERSGRVNILILGMGGPGHDGPFLTDTIILTSIQPSTKQVAMVSIPRDLGVNISEYGVQKINHANAYGENEKKQWGAAFATEVVEETFDTDIHYYVRIDFTAFKEIIDEIGGITVNVERSFTDSEYPAPKDMFQTISFAKGIQTMNGERALQYARSRHGNNAEGSDFARAKRQQMMLLALKEKILSFETLANPIRMHHIIQSLDTHITTNMEFADMIAFLKFAKTLHTESVKTIVLDSSPNGYLKNGFSKDGAFILEPEDGNFKTIRALIEHIFETNAAYTVPPPEQETPPIPHAFIEIQNGTWQAGLAARLRKRLTDAGFSVSIIGNTNARPHVESGIYRISEQDTSEVLAALKQTLDMPIKQALPTGIAADPGTDILVLIGENFQE